MSDYSNHEVGNENPNNHHSPDPDQLAQLRGVILGFDESKLDKLYERLDNPNLQAEDISRLLPEAVIIRSMQDKQLSEAIVPTIEEAIHFSVKKDLNILADALFPIIGPATRKAISTALQTMMQSFNQTIEHSLSPQSFKWRLEALQTGKSFAEVVLLRTLVYRVEQVFLIHRTTGLMLQHLVGEAAVVQDADLVSAMLTAIQNFVQDSFPVEAGDTFETWQFGELTLWIEQTPRAILAGLIRGHPPKELKLVFKETIEKINLKFSSALHSFDGDLSVFEASRSDLEACLQSQYKVKQEQQYRYVWALGSALAIALGIWSFFSIRDNRRWEAYLKKLNAEPGITVINAQKRLGKYFISGLHDPLAADPIRMIKQANVNPNAVISRWEPYLSLDAKIIEKRAEELLQAPKTVALRVDENRILYATGYASHEWIIETRKRARFIPGITQFQDNLTETDLKEFESLKEQIEKQVLYFSKGSTELEPGQDATLQTLVSQIQKLLDSAYSLDRDIQIKILGHTDKAGSKEANLRLSQARAQAVISTLVSQGINTTYVSAEVVNPNELLPNELTQQDGGLNRRVSFKVILTDSPNRATANP
ncbi:OmpA family protein [Allocoleopsis sp.]|uniref:OmpA family protein n=1 Tax=Allocoleopsis sp. TaxID=3088169 RepID=UPI002FD1A495